MGHIVVPHHFGHGVGVIYGSRNQAPAHRDRDAIIRSARSLEHAGTTGNSNGHANGTLLNTGLRYLKNEQYGRAANTMLQAVVADPEAGQPKLALGDALVGTGDYDYAAYAVRRGLDRVIDLANTMEGRRNLFSSRAELERLIYSLREHARQNPASGDARFLLGYYHRVAGQHDHANRSFDQALTIDPGDRHAALLSDLTRSADQ